MKARTWRCHYCRKTFQAPDPQRYCSTDCLVDYLHEHGTANVPFPEPVRETQTERLEGLFRELHITTPAPKPVKHTVQNTHIPGSIALRILGRVNIFRSTGQSEQVFSDGQGREARRCERPRNR